MKALYERICTPYATKQASILGGLAHALGSSALGHFTTNAFGRAAHHGSNIGDILAHRGFQHGLLEQSIAPTMKQSIKSVFGPEALINYEAALEAGRKLYQAAPDPITRQRMMREHLGVSGLVDKHLPNLQGVANFAGRPATGDAVVRAGEQIKRAIQPPTDAQARQGKALLSTALSVPKALPVLSPLQSAIHHELHGTTPTFQAQGLAANAYGKLLDRLTNNPIHGMETGAQRALKQMQGLAPAGALVATDTALGGGVPLGAVGHMAWNGLRQLGAATDVGQRVVAHEITKGLHKGMPKTTLYHDLGASPAYLDARRTGALVHDAIHNPRAAQIAQRNLGGVEHEGWVNPSVSTRELARAAKGATRKIQVAHNPIAEGVRRTLDRHAPPAIRVEPLLDRYAPQWNMQIKHEGTR